MARTPVDGIQAQPPSYGLLVALSTAVRDDPGLMVGITWPPEQCGESGRMSIDCHGSTADGRVAPTNPDVQDADPFVVFSEYRCSPLGWESIDYIGRADRQLAATQSFEIANELWTGTLAAADGLVNAALVDADSDTISSGAMDPVDALGCLEHALGRCGKGRRGLIHATPQVLVAWLAAYAVQKVGGQYVSPLGNIVVADAGYDGSGPGGVAAGASQWAYATDLMSVRLGTVITIPDTLESAMEWGIALDRSDNTVDVLAQRPAIIQWDKCCHLAAEIDLPTCAIGGAS